MVSFDRDQHGLRVCRFCHRFSFTVAAVGNLGMVPAELFQQRHDLRGFLLIDQRKFQSELIPPLRQTVRSPLRREDEQHQVNRSQSNRAIQPYGRIGQAQSKAWFDSFANKPNQRGTHDHDERDRMSQELRRTIQQPVKSGGCGMVFDMKLSDGPYGFFNVSWQPIPGVRYASHADYLFGDSPDRWYARCSGAPQLWSWRV